MEHRGRKSEGEVAVLAQRPDPPRDLTAKQKEIWRRVCSGLPVGWFREETLDLLAEYCEQKTLSAKLSKMIDKLPNDGRIEDLEKLVRLKEKTARMVISLATKMRISQQATYHSEKSKNPGAPDDDPW